MASEALSHGITNPKVTPTEGFDFANCGIHSISPMTVLVNSDWTEAHILEKGCSDTLRKANMQQSKAQQLRVQP